MSPLSKRAAGVPQPTPSGADGDSSTPYTAAFEFQDLSRKLMTIGAIRIGVVTVCLGALLAFAELPYEELRGWHSWMIVCAYFLSIGYVIVLRTGSFLVPLAYAEIVLDSLLITFLVALTRGIESIFAFVYVFTVLTASLTLYRRGAVVAMVSYFLFFGTLVLLQVDSEIKLLPPVNFGHGLFSFFMYSFGICVIAVLSSTLAEQLLRTGRELAARENDYEQLSELHAAIVRSLPAGLMTLEGDGVVTFANEAALSILGLGPDRILGRLLSEIAPTMAKRYDEHRPFVGGTSPRERFEESHRRVDGRRIRIGFSFAPLGATSGTKRSIAVFQDVTEIIRLKSAYERAERLATVGKLAAGLAHEVRNPLASMCASIDVLKRALDPPEPLGRLMANVVSEADRLNGLISDFLVFARPRPPTLRKTDIGQLVEGVLELARNDHIFEKIQVVTQFGENVSAAIDPDQIRQVLWNLIKNSSEAIGDRGGQLVLSTRGKDNEVEIVIRDSGPGIKPELLRRIFDPFFTTKERGSGLGLAISHSIIQAHGGRILLESKPGEGTEMTIVLPIASADSEPLKTDENSGAFDVSNEIELLAASAALEPTGKMRDEGW